MSKDRLTPFLFSQKNEKGVFKMKRGRLFARLICLAMSLTICFPSVFISALTPDNPNLVNYQEYFYELTSYVENDYASVYVSQNGGWDEGIDLNPTDFVATTYGEGFRYHNWYKELQLEAFFYEPDMITYYHAFITDEIPSSDSQYFQYTSSVVVYGADYVNEEYGLCDYTTDHYVYLYAPDDQHNGQMRPFTITYHIYVDTTGYYR